MSLENAKEALERAKTQLERVQEACVSEDHEEAVTWAFYAYENAVVSAAEINGLSWKKSHVSKVAVARELYQVGYVTVDVGNFLEELNDLRKNVSYGEPGADLESVDLEDLSSELENFIDQIDEMIDE